MQEVENEMKNIQKNNVPYFIDWIPNNVKTVACVVPPKNVALSGTFLGNNTVIHEIFKRVSAQFTHIFKKKTFLQWFISEGMEESEFIDAYAEVLDLVSEYQQYETVNEYEYSVDESYAEE
jgi:tubulin beta